MSYADVITQDIRLVCLRFLLENGYSLNESILHALVKAQAGYNVTRDKIETELAWLKEQGLVTLDDSPGFYIATITQRGSDIADGSATAPGVRRPSPRG